MHIKHERNIIALLVCFSSLHWLIFTIGTCNSVPWNDPQEHSYDINCHLERSKETRLRSYRPVHVFTWAYSIFPNETFETLPNFNISVNTSDILENVRHHFLSGQCHLEFLCCLFVFDRQPWNRWLRLTMVCCVKALALRNVYGAW